MSGIVTKIVEIPEKLSVGEALDSIENNQHGANCIFTGKVREYNQGRQVLGISYDVHVSLCVNIFNELAQEAQKQWGEQLQIYIAHAQGKLTVGELSIVIAVGSKHRDESFKAARFLIEEIKHRCPIWKQEHYVDGDSEWVQGHALCQHG